jgi:preprotein translocase subunit YajC
MFVSPAYAQAAGGGAGGGLEALLPLVLIFVVFYFLLIRPQQKKMKEHKETLGGIRRGDKIVTGGGIIGTVSKVDDDNVLTVEIAKDVKVKVRRELVSTVLSKTTPVKGAAANDDKAAPAQGGFLSTLFSGGKKQSDAAPVDAQDEDKPKPAKKPRKPRKKKAANKSDDKAAEASGDQSDASDSGEASDEASSETKE